MSVNKNIINNILAVFNSGETVESLKKIKNLIKSNNNDLKLIFTYGFMNMKLKKNKEAIRAFEHVLSNNSSHLLSLKYLYIICLQQNNLEKSLQLIDRIIKLEPKNYEALRDKAYVLYLKKLYINSEKFIDKAININNQEVFGINIKGLILIKKNKNFEAIKTFKKAILIDKNYADSYNNLGKCYFDNENLQLAFVNFKKSFRLNPNSDLTHANIGNVLSLYDKYNAAVNFYKKGLKLNPSNSELLSNIAICFCKVKDLVKAEKYYKQTIKLLPNDNELKLAYCYILIHFGFYKEAWKLFDSRLNIPRIKKMNKYHENIEQKISKEFKISKNDKILIVREQGVGDEILFSSMYKDLLKTCSNVKIEADPRLIDIFERSFKKNIFYKSGYFSNNKSKLKDFNKIFYAGSLAKIFRNNESDFPKNYYIKSNKLIDVGIKKELEIISTKPKIGISWKSVINVYGKLKSLNLIDFKSLFDDKKLFINLQYGETQSEIDNFKKEGFGLYTFKEVDLFNDFESCLSILKNLDIFVTVSNSTAHLAAASGVKTIVICPKKSSTYYYWDYKKRTTPWYKSVDVVKYNNSLKDTINETNKLINSILWNL